MNEAEPFTDSSVRRPKAKVRRTRNSEALRERAALAGEYSGTAMDSHFFTRNLD
jgi:hypothetical protein